MILETADPLPEGVRTVDHAQELFNSVWTVSLAPLRPWYLQISLWLGVAVSLLVALLAAAGVYYAGRQLQLQLEKSQRAIQQLQEQLEREQGNMLLNQIRSHFFYHTLNALQALIVLKPEAAYKMAGDFARYLRFTLDSVTADGGSAPSGRRSGRSGPMRISTSSSWGTGCTWSTRFPTWTFPSPC